jgi:hypothetical protein
MDFPMNFLKSAQILQKSSDFVKFHQNIEFSIEFNVWNLCGIVLCGIMCGIVVLAVKTMVFE